MKLETFPLILGGLVALLGIALILDGWLDDFTVLRRERRRRPRRERDRMGEILMGIGVLGMAAAFIGRDVWRYRIVAAIAGAIFLLWGMLKNGKYLREVLVNRGAKRRAYPPMDRGMATKHANEAAAAAAIATPAVATAPPPPASAPPTAPPSDSAPSRDVSSPDDTPAHSRHHHPHRPP